MDSDIGGVVDLNELARHARSGDQFTTTRLFRQVELHAQHVPETRKILQQDLPSVVNQAFHEALRKWKPAGGASFKTFFVGILKRRCIDQVRRTRRHQRIGSLTLPDDNDAAISDPGLGPAIAAEKDDEIQRLRGCFEQLPRNARVLLAEWSGITEWESIPTDPAAEELRRQIGLSGRSNKYHARVRVIEWLRECMGLKTSNGEEPET